jgi:septal ring factor EnvC (AmiA/AmiB activator)
MKFLAPQLQETINKDIANIKAEAKLERTRNEVLLETIERQDNTIEELESHISLLEAKTEEEESDYNDLLTVIDDCYKFGYNADRLEKINDEYRILCLNVKEVVL